MGGKSTKMPKNGEFFLQGPENFTYDEHKAIFEKNNGLLFRLVNTQEKQWAFYNDTKKYEFHVTVTFGSSSSDLIALGKSSLVENPEGGWIGKTIVYPGSTEPFVQGNVVGFESTVNAVLLTTEYIERKKEEKREAKKAAKRAKKDGTNGPDANGASNSDTASNNH